MPLASSFCCFRSSQPFGSQALVWHYASSSHLLYSNNRASVKYRTKGVSGASRCHRRMWRVGNSDRERYGREYERHYASSERCVVRTENLGASSIKNTKRLIKQLAMPSMQIKITHSAYTTRVATLAPSIPFSRLINAQEEPSTFSIWTNQDGPRRKLINLLLQISMSFQPHFISMSFTVSQTLTRNFRS